MEQDVKSKEEMQELKERIDKLIRAIIEEVRKEEDENDQYNP